MAKIISHGACDQEEGCAFASIQRRINDAQQSDSGMIVMLIWHEGVPGKAGWEWCRCDGNCLTSLRT